MVEAAKKLPDFIILGAMKCATSTLHVQLGAQDGIHVSTPKEPNFFSDDSIFAKGLDWYHNLFSSDPNSINGESSTHYTKFPTYPETISRMKQCGITEQTKFIYIVRHPRDRLISHYLHEVSQGNIKSDINSALRLHPELIDYSRYNYQIDHYFSEFTEPEVLLVFFEKLKVQPQSELERVASFLGIQSSVTWDFNTQAQNVTSDRIRKFPFYSKLVESNLATTLRRSLVPKSVRTKIRDSLKIKNERPTLSASSEERLSAAFSQDLCELGKRAGITLDYENYLQVASEAEATVLTSPRLS